MKCLQKRCSFVLQEVLMQASWLHLLIAQAQTWHVYPAHSLHTRQSCRACLRFLFLPKLWNPRDRVCMHCLIPVNFPFKRSHHVIHSYAPLLSVVLSLRCIQAWPNLPVCLLFKDAILLFIWGSELVDKVDGWMRASTYVSFRAAAPASSPVSPDARHLCSTRSRVHACHSS